jgi:Arc/MetJ family transcription regulator
MPKTALDIDRGLLAQAKEVLGAKTYTETIERALQAVIDRHRREAFFDYMATRTHEDLDAVDHARAGWEPR